MRWDETNSCVVDGETTLSATQLEAVRRWLERMGNATLNMGQRRDAQRDLLLELGTTGGLLVELARVGLNTVATRHRAGRFVTADAREMAARALIAEESYVCSGCAATKKGREFYLRSSPGGVPKVIQPCQECCKARSRRRAAEAREAKTRLARPSEGPS